MGKDSLKDKSYTEHLTCSKETKKLIMGNCIQDFLEHHPEFENMNITSGFILAKMAEFYLKGE